MAQSPARIRIRRVVDMLHRWLGFTCGAILVVAGLTGALLAFYMELDGSLNPALRTSAPHAQPQSYEAVYQRLRQMPSADSGYWKIEIPPSGGPITGRFYNVPSNTMARTRMVTLDPQRLTVLRDARWQETFFTWIYDLHMNLLMGASGKIAMGILAIGMVVLLLGGVANWALPTGSLRAKLRVKAEAKLPRRTYDLHKIVGLVSFPLMFLTVGTAVMICLPDQVKPILNAFSSLKATPNVVSRPGTGGHRISVDRAIARGQDVFPGSTVVWVKVPHAPTDAYDLQIRQAGDPMTRFPKSHVWVDQYSGAVLAARDPHTDTAGDTVLNWLVPLHDGKAFGMTGRILVLLMGLSPAVLLVTGVMRWTIKRRATRGAMQRRLARAA